MSDQTIKVSGAKPEDWGVRKAEAMTEQRVQVIDKQLARAKNRLAASDERDEVAAERREHRPGRRRQKIQAYRAS